LLNQGGRALVFFPQIRKCLGSPGQAKRIVASQHRRATSELDGSVLFPRIQGYAFERLYRAMNLCGQSVGFRILWIFFNGLLMEVGGFPQFTAISAGHTLQATIIAVETLSRLTLRRASQELSRVSCTLPVLHCTDDSQQTVEKGQPLHIHRIRATSA